jgi:probable HAF family extracellular repeat protein
MKNFSDRMVGILAGAVLLCSGAMGQNGGLRFTLTDLGTINGGLESRAFAINNKGQVVGTAFFPTGDSKCFVWQNGSAVVFTFNTKTTRCEATAISADGTIAGSLMPPANAPCTVHSLVLQRGLSAC